MVVTCSRARLDSILKAVAEGTYNNKAVIVAQTSKEVSSKAISSELKEKLGDKCVLTTADGGSLHFADAEVVVIDNADCLSIGSFRTSDFCAPVTILLVREKPNLANCWTDKIYFVKL